MRLCIIYDCLYPWTIGGAERWYRLLADRMATDGHEVTYLTRRQWPPDAPPRINGVRVLEVSGPGGLYTGERRAVAPPVAFGQGVYRHLGRHGARYDAVISASFPYFPMLAAARLRSRFDYRLVVDWWEVWSGAYWREYLGPVRGHAGSRIQEVCARSYHHARCASRLHADRLANLGHRGEILPIGGIHVAPAAPPDVRPASDYFLVSGRLTRDKGADLIVPALAAARESLPWLRAIVAGDGPARASLQAETVAAGLSRDIEFRGFVSESDLAQLTASAICLLNPSRREGFGLSVLDAVSQGVPAVLATSPDNAATDLVIQGVNGEIAESATGPALASAILRVQAAGPALRQSTLAWWAANRTRFDAEDGLRRAGTALFGPLSPP